MSIKESCKDGWHKEKNMWAYVNCDCAHCKEGRAEIAKRIITKFLKDCRATGMTTLPNLRDFNTWIKWEEETPVTVLDGLDKEETIRNHHRGTCFRVNEEEDKVYHLTKKEHELVFHNGYQAGIKFEQGWTGINKTEIAKRMIEEYKVARDEMYGDHLKEESDSVLEDFSQYHKLDQEN